jgi:hypothetical protein
MIMILKLLAFKIKVFLYKLYKIIKISNQINQTDNNWYILLMLNKN